MIIRQLVPDSRRMTIYLVTILTKNLDMKILIFFGHGSLLNFLIIELPGLLHLYHTLSTQRAGKVTEVGETTEL